MLCVRVGVKHMQLYDLIYCNPWGNNFDLSLCLSPTVSTCWSSQNTQARTSCVTGCWLHCIVEAMVTLWHDAYPAVFGWDAYYIDTHICARVCVLHFRDIRCTFSFGTEKPLILFFWILKSKDNGNMTKGREGCIVLSNVKNVC